MKCFRALYGSSIGRKAIAAVTGLIMVGCLISHLSGNLKVFLPDPEPGVADIDLYEEYKRAMELRPADKDDAVLRWNTCVRMIERHPHCAPDPEDRVDLGIE